MDKHPIQPSSEVSLGWRKLEWDWYHQHLNQPLFLILAGIPGGTQVVPRWGVDESNEQFNTQGWELKAVGTAHPLLEGHPQVLELVILGPGSLKSTP